MLVSDVEASVSLLIQNDFEYLIELLSIELL